jgi:hypothetical protein
MLIGGLLAKLHLDYVEEPIDPQRQYAAERVAASACTSVTEALLWLDWSDRVAIDTAEKIRAAEPYVEIELPHTVH